MNTSQTPAELETVSTNAPTHEISSGVEHSDADIFADPFILIEAESQRVRFDLKQLWVYRELLFFLIWRDIKIRYKQTLLGSSWAIIQPLFAMLLFTLIFGRLARMPSDGIPYPLFAYAGLVLWTFFANSLTSSGNSLVGSSSLITKVYFPRVIIPGAAVLAGLLDLIIASLLLVPLLLYYRVSLTWNLLLLPVFVLIATLLALGVGMWLSALNVKYRDVRYALPFLVQLWLFASPVIYPTSLVPERWHWVFALNPMTGIIDGFRTSLLGGKFDTLTILTSAALTITILFVSFLVFQRVEDSFADIV